MLRLARRSISASWLPLIPTRSLSSPSCIHHRLLITSASRESFYFFLDKFIPTSTHVYPYNFKSVLRLACHSYSCTTGDSSAACQIGNASGAGREILVKHLLVEEDDFDLLLELEQRISNGENFSDLAAEYSICPSKQDKGNLGWVRTGHMVPEFEEASFNAPLNKVVRCKTAYGWHLLQVLSEREESLLIDIQPEELHAKMQDPVFLVEAQLIDVREPDELAQAALPGFKNLPLKQLDTWGPEMPTKFDRKKDTYVLCHHGRRSMQVAKWLQNQGFQRIYNIQGGIHEYSVKVDPSVPTY